MKSLKLRFLLFAAMLIAASWIGYWVGYVTTRSTLPTNQSVQGYNLQQMKHDSDRGSPQQELSHHGNKQHSVQGGMFPQQNAGGHLEDGHNNPKHAPQEELYPQGFRNRFNVLNEESNDELNLAPRPRMRPAGDLRQEEKREDAEEDEMMEELMEDTVHEQGPLMDKRLDTGRQDSKMGKLDDGRIPGNQNIVLRSEQDVNALSDRRNQLEPGRQNLEMGNLLEDKNDELNQNKVSDIRNQLQPRRENVEMGDVAADKNGELNQNKLSDNRNQLQPWMDMKPAGLQVPQGDTGEIHGKPLQQLYNQEAPPQLAGSDTKKDLKEDVLSPVGKNPAAGIAHAGDGLSGGKPVHEEHYTLIHAGNAARVHGKMHAHIKVMENVAPSSYIFTSNSLSSDPRMRPSIANGHVGTAIHRDMMFMNGLYNGRYSQSSRAAIPSTCSFNITGTTPATNFTRTYTLNVGEGIYSELTVSRYYNITQRIYAHRTYNRLIVAEVDLSRAVTGPPLTLNVKLNRWVASRDITFLASDSGMDEVSYKHGHVNAPETPTSGATEVHILYDHIPDTLVAPANSGRTKWVFITAVSPTNEETYKAYAQGRELIQSHDQLYADHVVAWYELWKRGRIDVDNNEQLSRALHGAMYYLLSSLPLEEDKSWPFVGLSPSGLPFGDYSSQYWDYQGHVFWDQETWMFPPILTLHADLARILVKTRERTMDAATENAKLNGRQGYMYPWESAYTGVEVTPSKPIAQREIHITGDISLALQQYLDMTNDISLLSNDKGNLTNITTIITNIANYWVSRLIFNETMNAYTILDVIPPDEYVEHANNSVYTNAVAKLSLSLPKKAFDLLKKKKMDRWQVFADQIYIPYDTVRKYHPEYDGYVFGTKIKQADAVMLGYPLNQPMTPEVRRNDLSNYEKVTSVQGPAMSWAMYTIGWLEMGEKEKAGQLFRKNYFYIKNAFQVWRETTAGDGATNFITGMGGFLQAVINGYGGIRIHSDGLFLNPIPPLDTQGLHLIGVDYQGRSLDIFAREDEVLVVLTSQPPDHQGELKIYLENPEEVLSLELNQGVKYNPRPAVIKLVKT